MLKQAQFIKSAQHAEQTPCACTGALSSFQYKTCSTVKHRKEIRQGAEIKAVELAEEGVCGTWGGHRINL